MSMYNVDFEIVNNTDQTMNFDSAGSNGTHDWPTTVAPYSSSGRFTQSGSFSVNLTAVYSMGNSGVNAYLHYYLTGLDPAVHVNMSLNYSNNGVFTSNTIAETNSNKNQSRSGQAPLSFDRTDDGSSNGDATYTLG